MLLAQFCILPLYAFISFQSAIEISPQDEKAWYGKYSALRSLARLPEAEDAFKKASALDRSKFEHRINDINYIINSWTLPERPVEFVDSKSFVVRHDAHLAKIGGQIKIRTANVGDIDITYDDLRGDSGRIGIDFEFLNLLKNRLSAFKKALDEATGEQSKHQDK